MRPASALAGAACSACVAVSLCCLGPAAAVGGTAARPHLQVIEIEYRLILSRGVLHAGAVGLEAIDRGQDPHDLRLRRVGARGETAVPQLSSGQRWDATVDLRPGVYRLWCSLPEHARLGMHATLRVVR